MRKPGRAGFYLYRFAYGRCKRLRSWEYLKIEDFAESGGLSAHISKSQATSPQPSSSPLLGLPGIAPGSGPTVGAWAP